MSSDGVGGTRSPVESVPGMLRSSRVAVLVPKLKSLETTQDLASHAGLVRHLQFSPDGNYLATARCVRSREVSLYPLMRLIASSPFLLLVGIRPLLSFVLGYVHEILVFGKRVNNAHDCDQVPFTSHWVLAHPQGFVHQVAW